jgi:RNA polymerase sigma-70 factor (ECF subfamily)
MIYRVTRNREDAEDALQSSILRALLHIKQFDGRSSFATWFTRIGINSALMILRQKRFRVESSIDSTPEEESWHPLQIADYGLNPEEHYIAYERSKHLKRAICQLPAPLRSVVELGKMEGHSIKKIAHRMGISVPATKSRLGRAKAALRKSMT